MSGRGKVCKGAMQLFLADTVAAHQIGGFKVGVGLSLCKCRHCMAHLDEIQSIESKVRYICMIHIAFIQIITELYTYTV